MRIVGVDTGGTFTDFLFFDGRALRSHKKPSDPVDPASVLRTGLAEMGAGAVPVVHGTTIATNAFLERKGARVVFVTNQGFEDLLEIGRQARATLYDPSWRKPEPLVPRRRCVGVAGRIGPGGGEEEPPGRQPLLPRDAEIAAICLLHSYANPRHERRVAAQLPIPSVCSSDLVPEYREYERAATTVVNAYVLPIMKDYLQRLDRDVRILASNGGGMTAKEASERPVHTILSGPAGGVVATRSLGFPKAISFDMGGTSTDVAVLDGDPRITKEGTIGGIPLRIPMIEIHTVGAGGGSIARVDATGALRVGPESSGAQPGPACYGHGGRAATVTDANVVLGRIDPAQFLGGRMPLDPGAAERALHPIARRLRCSMKRAAQGILEVAEATMERAIRLITVERGIDPSEFVLVAFGGAGPLHACALAEALRIRTVAVPPWPGLFSALGMILADEVTERWRSVLTSPDRIAPRAGRWFEMRYRGQSYEIRCRNVREFHRLHRERYGFARPGDPVEVVNVGERRVRRTPKPKLQGRGPMRLKGPVVFTEDNATTFVPPGWSGKTRGDGTLILSRT